MSDNKNKHKIGYTRREFTAIFQLYSQNVYTGLFRDFSFTESGGHYFISFREEAGKTPLITVKKERIGPDRALFTATTPGLRGAIVEIAKSEKIDAFVRQLREKIDTLNTGRTLSGNVVDAVSAKSRNLTP